MVARCVVISKERFGSMAGLAGLDINFIKLPEAEVPLSETVIKVLLGEEY